MDIGAGIGTEMFAYADRLGAEGHIYAIEAHPSTFKRLRLLYSLNRGKGIATPVTLQCAAATDRDGTAQISDGNNDVVNSLVSEGGISTEAITLDAFLAVHAIARVDFLKMNIEGAETAALDGAKETLRRTRNGTIGCHDFLADDSGDAYFRTKASVHATLEKAGFRVTERPEGRDPWTRDYLYFTR